ncbi:MAG: hypothetical protein COB37_03815 [Kordiimonadales bacterium]|nr:MAG: hypothetical protein COB37_03815 [Kordiimonadales bacterium]
MQGRTLNFVTKSMVKTKRIPKQARAKARIAAILSATDALLRSSLPSNITTTAIAHTAKIPVGSVYQYFRDKNDILEQLYAEASKQVEELVLAEQSAVDPALGFDHINRTLLQCFWQTARSHPTFGALTRWANREHSFVEVTPGTDSSLARLIMRTFEITGINLPAARKEAVLRISVTVVSAVVDIAFEEDDADKAQTLIDELALLLSGYLA